MRPSFRLLALTGSIVANAQAAVTCQDGLHVIVARASGEPAGFGILKPIKDKILQEIPNSDAVAVNYPAKITDPIYTVSETEGVGNLTQLVTQYGDACPGYRMALLGYSQGAHVVGDTLIGADYNKFPAFDSSKTGVAQKYVDSVVAVVMMGDPANVAGEPFLHGNSTRSGFFPRNNTASWGSKGLLNKVISYCDAEDTYCDSGNSIVVHVSYVGKYGAEAAQFVVDKFNASNSTNSTTPTPTGTAGQGPSGTNPAPSSTSSSASTALTMGLDSKLFTLFGLVNGAFILNAVL